MTRVLVLTYEFPPIGGGGGQAAKDISLGLVERGYEVSVITTHLKGLPRKEDLKGLKVIRVSSGRRWAYKADLPEMGGFVAFGFLTSWQYFRIWRPDIIHVHFAVPTGPIAWLLSRLTGVPYLLTAHLGDVPGGVPEKTDKWFRWVYPFTRPIWRDAARVVAVSEHTRQLALEHYPVSIQVIPNGIDLKSYKPGEIRVGNPPQIVFAGRFREQKNLLQLVRSLAELRDIPWKCVMIGDGPLKGDVEGEILKHNLQERFKLPGWVTPEEVISWFRHSDILFMPSLTEGLPVVGVQALAMGLAIVASRVGGFVDLVTPGENGHLIYGGYNPGYSEALKDLLTDPDHLRSFKEASRKKASCFDLPEIVNSYVRLFNEVLTPLVPENKVAF